MAKTNVTAQMVKELRDKTGAGMMDCKSALGETDGDMEAAVDWLRKKGLAKAAKKAGRIAAEGLIGVAVGGLKGVVVEVNSETDFVARNEQFQGLVRMIANVALDVGTDVEAIKAGKVGDHLTVNDAINSAIATIGENMSLRRAGQVSVTAGAIPRWWRGRKIFSPTSSALRASRRRRSSRSWSPGSRLSTRKSACWSSPMFMIPTRASPRRSRMLKAR